MLSPEQREILTLHCIVGLPHREIAARFGRTVEASPATASPVVQEGLAAKEAAS